MAAGYNTGDDEEGYITVGEARELGASIALRPGLVPRPAAQPPATRLLSPNALRTLVRPTAISPAASAAMRTQLQSQGISEQRARQLIEEYLGQFSAQIEARYPYGDIPPKPVDGEAMFPMGLGTATLTSVNGGISLLQAQPQRAFRGERLITSVTRSAGAAGIGVVIRDFSIGDYKQLVGGGSLPVEVFASDAFGVRLMLDGSIPGVLYAITVAALAPIPVGESITIAGAVIGRAGEAAQR